MKKINILLSLIALSVIGLASFVSEVNAQECHTTYGAYGGEVCDNGDVEVDKLVWQVKNNKGETVEKWRDNIDTSSDGYTFESGEEVKFELRVKNTGDVKLKKITLRDILPSYLEYSNGGEYFSDSRTVEWKIYDLEPSDTAVKNLYVKFVGEDNLSEGITCVTNKAEVYVKDGDSDNDTAMVCTQKGASEKKEVLGVTTLPETGPMMPIALAVESIWLGGLGVGFVRVNRKYSLAEVQSEEK